jgi:hypothetical protein
LLAGEQAIPFARSYVFKSEVHMDASGDRGETAMAADDVRDGESW